MNLSLKEKILQISKNIPKGKVLTYKRLAELAGRPNSARYVGLLMSKNKDRKKIPCHRVVASDGSLKGYAFGGITQKQKILAKEGVCFKGNKIDLKKSLWK